MQYNKKASFRPKYRTPSTFRVMKSYKIRKIQLKGKK